MEQKNEKDRMKWIRMLEDLDNEGKNEFTHIGEYEILSECRIGGILNYDNSKILCGGFGFEKSKEGLYTYLLKITHPGPDLPSESATKKGYHFKDGVVGELMVLLSLFLQCRFYLGSTMYGELTNTGLKMKFPYEYSRLQCNPAIHPQIFSFSKRNFAIGIEDFLDKVKKLPTQYHQQFILAAYHYLRALREVGIDTEMVYIRLVSAIEALSSNFIELTTEEDPLKGKDIDKVLEELNYQKLEKSAIKDTFNTRCAGKKIVKFINKYSTRYITGGNYKSKNTKIRKKDLPKTIKAIYNARSNYLHNGEPMYLSIGMGGSHKWDTDPSLGMMIDNRSYSVSQKLPYPYWFEGLVRHCLLNFLDEKTK